jgi:2-polyprenyl-3-methyl-5-hydroxy-6-metoxy-1,4-benzoquinol methylase
LPFDRVVELGYGEGITLKHLSKIPAHYTMIEGAPSLLKIVRQRHPTVEAIGALFEEYRPSEPFDKLLALHVFEHVDNPVRLAMHLATWLKPDGEMVVIVPNKDSLHRRLAVSMGLMPELSTLSQRDHLVGHQRVYNLESLEVDLQDAGFEIFERRGFFLKTLPNSMMVEHSPELVKALNVIGSQLPPEMLANIAIRARLMR